MSLTRAMDLHWKAHIGLPQVRFIETKPTLLMEMLIDTYQCCICNTTIDVVYRKKPIKAER